MNIAVDKWLLNDRCFLMVNKVFLKLCMIGLVSLSSFCISAANTKNEVECFLSSKDLIKNLYATFPIDGKKVVESSDKKIISKFFSSDLTNMLLSDYRCREKTGGVCNIDFNILSNSQDDLGGFKILQATNNVVTVKFDTPMHGEFIDFYIENKGLCKVIKDIEYNNTNLLNILKK